MRRNARFDVGGSDPEAFHIRVVFVRISRRERERLLPLFIRASNDFVIYVRDIADEKHLEAQPL